MSGYTARPLRRLPGLSGWASRDGRWRFGRMEADGWWHVWYEADGDGCGYGDKHATLRDAVASVEAQGGEP